MNTYNLSFTAEQIDEKLHKIDDLVSADAMILQEAKSYTDSQRLAYEVPEVIGKVFECTVPAGENDVSFRQPFRLDFYQFSTLPVTINGKSFDATISYGERRYINVEDYLSIIVEDTNSIETPVNIYVDVYDPDGNGDSVDRHVSIDVDVVLKEASISTIDPKYLPDYIEDETVLACDASKYLNSSGYSESPVNLFIPVVGQTYFIVTDSGVHRTICTAANEDGPYCLYGEYFGYEVTSDGVVYAYNAYGSTLIIRQDRDAYYEAMRINNLKNSVDNLSSLVGTPDDTSKTVTYIAENASTLAIWNAEKINSIEKYLSNIELALESIINRLDSLESVD